MAAFLDGCRFTPTAGGLTDWTVSSAVTGYQTPAAAGAVNGTVYRYRAESADLTQWEIGYGAYTSAGTVLARTTVLFNSLGTTAKISFSAAPQVAVVALKEDLISVEEANSFTAAQKGQARTNIAAVLKGQLFGLTLSTAGSSSTFGIAAGEAADSTGVDLLTLASAYTKTTAAWAVGTGNGSFDGTGAAPSATSGWYHVFLIKRPDTGVVDVLTSNSATAPTLPANYTLLRRIGSMKTNGSFQWIKFIQTGDEFLWDVSNLDVNAGAPTTTNTVYTLASIPVGISVLAFLRLVFTNTGAAASALISSTLTGVQIANTPTGNANLYATAANAYQDTEARIWTNTSAQVNASGSAAANNQLFINVFGYSDRRGRDA